jgi:methylated-DNA-[protein]-cysteine S-methyltransferase
MTFKEKVLRVVSKIPKGETLTYKEVAQKAGNSRACRAVGRNILNQNYNSRIPCHRVVRSDGRIGGYNRGIRAKTKKLKSEEAKGNYLLNKGIATLELLIAIAIVTVTLSGSVMVAFGGQTAGLDVNLTNHGLYRVKTGISETVASLISDWNSAENETIEDDIYTKTSVISNVTHCLKQVNYDVDWVTEKFRDQNLNSATLVSSIEEVENLGGDCDPFPPTDWDAPSSYPFANPIFSGSSASDVDVIKRSGGERFALVTTLKNPSPSGSNTFWIIDVSDLDADPVQYSAFETPNDLLSVDAIQDFAFTVGLATEEQNPLIAFDIRDENNIVLVASSSLPNTEGHNSFEKIRSVYYYDGIVYVGADYMIGSEYHEFHFFEFDDNNPENLNWQDSINVDRKVNDIVVQNGIAYLATGPGGDNAVLRIYDVDPSSVSYLELLGSFAASSQEDGTSLYLLGNYIYLGRERTTGSNHDFFVIDISDPTNPTLADSAQLALNNNTEVSGIFVNGNIAFIVTSDQTPANGGGPFIMFDVRDPTDISIISPCTAVNWSEKATGLDMVDDLAFVSNDSNDALQVIYPTLSCT